MMNVLTHTYHEMPGSSLPEFYSANQENVVKNYGADCTKTEGCKEGILVGCSFLQDLSKDLMPFQRYFHLCVVLLPQDTSQILKMETGG